MRSTEPVPFTPKVVPKVLEPYEPIIKHLERLLEQAKSGELTAIAYAMVTTDGATVDSHTNCGIAVAPGTSYGMAYALATLNRRWGEECDR